MDMSQLNAQNNQDAQKKQQELMMKMINNGNPILCKCGCNVFKEGIQLVRCSSIDPANPTGKDQIMHIPALYCVKCMNPVEVK